MQPAATRSLDGDDFGSPVQQRLAFVGEHLLPRVARAVGGGEGVFDIAQAGLCHPREDLAGGRIDVIGDVAVAALAPGAVDVHRVNTCAHRVLLNRSAILSPIIAQGAMVLPVVIAGITEPSAIRRFRTPYTRSEPSTTDMASRPILAVHVG
jgi:hypothetical protein